VGAHLFGVAALVGVVLDGGFTVGLLEVFRGRVLGHPEDLVVLRVVALLRRAPEHLGETKRNETLAGRSDGEQRERVCEEIEETARRLYSYSGAGERVVGRNALEAEEGEADRARVVRFGSDGNWRSFEILPVSSCERAGGRDGEGSAC
jgi:hypothetical protein